MANKIGILTIGQAPRVDMTPDMVPFFPKTVEVIEMGALDGLSESELESLQPQGNEDRLITRLANGGSVVVSEKLILGKLKEKIEELERLGASTIILACTGVFPEFQSNIPILFPDKVLFHVVKGILPNGRLGVILPLEEQRDQIKQKWENQGFHMEYAVASPYHHDHISFQKAAEELGTKGVDCIIMDCMGYTQEMKQKVRQMSGEPVVLSRSIVARVAGELLN